MSFDFNADDIFEMAEQMERNGAKFYQDAAATISDPNRKKMLLDLAQMELDHEKTYKALRAELKGKEKGVTLFDPHNESALYLHALANTRVFFQKPIDLSSLSDILKAAIQAEKDSIVFYLGMKGVVPETFGKGRIDDIIREEMGHIQMLSKELIALHKGLA